MSIYLTIVFCLLITGFFNINKKIFFGVSTIVFILLLGLRARTVGFDTLQYYNNYSRILYLGFNQRELSRYEFGYFSLNKIVSLVSDNPQFFIFVTSTILIASTFYFVKKYSQNYQISFLAFILFGIMGTYMNLLRQALAISILIFFTEIFFSKKKVLSFLVIFLASLFHSTAWIFLVPVILYNIRGKWSTNKIVVGVFVLSLILAVSSNVIFIIAVYIFPQYQVYIDSVHASAGVLASTINFIIMTFLVIIGYLYLKKNNYEFSKFENFIFLMCLTDMMLSAIGVQVYLIYRLAYYFRVFQLLWIPIVIKSSKNINEKVIIGWSFFCLGILYFTVVHLFRPEWTAIVPYHFFWE